MSKKSFIINAIIPTIYLLLLILAKLKLLPAALCDNIWGNGLLLWLLQLLIGIISFFFVRTQLGRLFLVIIFLIFLLFEYKTLHLFNVYYLA